MIEFLHSTIFILRNVRVTRLYSKKHESAIGWGQTFTDYVLTGHDALDKLWEDDSAVDK
jgi:hypothetical protein